jgi:hypothetical protein
MSNPKPVSSQADAPMYIILDYDVPSGTTKEEKLKAQRMYGSIYSKIKPFCCSKSKSVLLAPFDQMINIQRILEPYTEEGLVWDTVKIHNGENEKMLDVAKDKFRESLKHIGDSIKKKIDELKKKGEAPNLTKGQARGFSRTFRDIEAAIAVFRLTEDMDSLLVQYREVVSMQLQSAGCSVDGSRGSTKAEIDSIIDSLEV